MKVERIELEEFLAFAGACCSSGFAGTMVVQKRKEGRRHEAAYHRGGGLLWAARPSFARIARAYASQRSNVWAAGILVCLSVLWCALDAEPGYRVGGYPAAVFIARSHRRRRAGTINAGFARGQILRWQVVCQGDRLVDRRSAGHSSGWRRRRGPRIGVNYAGRIGRQSRIAGGWSWE